MQMIVLSTLITGLRVSISSKAVTVVTSTVLVFVLKVVSLIFFRVFTRKFKFLDKV